MELKNNDRVTWFLYEHYLHQKSMIETMGISAKEKRLSIKLKLSVSKKQVESRLEKVRRAKPDAVLYLKQKSSCTSFGQNITQRPKRIPNGQAWPKLPVQNQVKTDHPFKFGERSPFFDKIHSSTNLPKPDFSVSRISSATNLLSRSRKFSYEPQLISNTRLREVS